MSEMCCTRLAENTGRKSYAKIAICALSHYFVGLCLRNWGICRQSEKIVNNNIYSTCSCNMVNFCPLTAEICWGGWAPQQISTVFASWLRYCTDFAQRRSTKLCTMFGRLLGWYTCIHFWGSCPVTEFCQLQNSLCVQVAFSCIGSVTARRWSIGRQPKFAAWDKEWNYGTSAEGATYIRHGGHHVGHRPTF